MRDARLNNQNENVTAGQYKRIGTLGLLLAFLLIVCAASAQEYRKPTMDSDLPAAVCGSYGSGNVVSGGSLFAAYDGASPSTSTSAGTSVSGEYDYSSAYDRGPGALVCHEFYGFSSGTAQYGATTLTVTGSLSVGMGESQSASLEYSVNNGGSWYTLAYTSYWVQVPSGPWIVNLPNGQDPTTVRIRLVLTASGGALAYGPGPGSAYASISDIYITGNVTPAAPTSLSGTAAANGTSISLTWTDNATNESSYKIQRCTGSGCTPTDLVTGRPANSVSYNDTTAANTSYRYNVCAVNAAVTTCAATPITVTTPPPPAAPTSVAATAAANGLSVSLTWVDNATDESSYKIQRCTGSGCTPADLVTGRPASSSSYSDTTVANTAYRYNVCAINAVGTTCAAAPVAVTTPAPPAAPTNLAGSPAANGLSVSLTWTDNATNETSYKIQRCTGSSCTPADRATGRAANTASYSDTTAANTIYRYNVCAVNAVGTACAAAPIAVTTPAPPAAPTSLTGTAAATGLSVSLAWVDNANNETSYKIQRCIGSSCTLADLVTGRPANSVSYSDTTAVNTTYRYNVCAVNAVGTSCAATPATVSTVPDSPAAPTALAATPAANGLSVSLTWVDNANNETSYKIQRCTGSGCTPADLVTGRPANAVSYSDTTAASTTYRYNVCAVNAAAAICAGTPVTVTTPAAPAAPTSLTATAAGNGLSVSLAWRDNAANETSYKIQRCTGSSCTPVDLVTGRPANSASYSDTTTANTTYRYNICAVNAVGATCAATPVTITTPFVPAAPTNVTATLDGSAVRLNWSDNATNESSYKVQRCSGTSCTLADLTTGLAANLTSYSDTTVVAGTYRYNVCAVAGVTTCSTTAVTITVYAGFGPVVGKYVSPDGIPMYEPSGALSRAKIGSCARVVNNYNNRLQPWTLSAENLSSSGNSIQCDTSGGTGTFISKEYNFHYGNGDNGNVYAIVDKLPDSLANDRSVDYNYDNLNRITSAQSRGTDCTPYSGGATRNWGQSYTIDAWGNMTQTTVTKCSAGSFDEGLAADTRNQFNTGAKYLPGYGPSQYRYDAAGNLTEFGTYTYDAESRISSVHSVLTGDYTYGYDGDGNRIIKNPGKLYWAFSNMGSLAESDLTGRITAEYIFFDGKRVARVDYPTETTQQVHYYFSDHLGSATVILAENGKLEQQSEYYPYGGERVIFGGDSNVYKFTGKERDSETGNDYFGARYFSSPTGRWMSPDEFSGGPMDLFDTDDPASQALPYANIFNPQSLNKYSYTYNNPLRYIDPDGHDTWDFIQGAANAFGSDFFAGAGRNNNGNGDFKDGQVLGDALATVGGLVETGLGAGVEVGGLVLDATGVGAIVGVPANVVGAVAIVQGGAATVTGAAHLMKASQAAGVTAGGQATDKHGKKLGPSDKPQVNQVNHSTTKRAKDTARAEGKRAPVKHPSPKKGKPHFHPTDKNGEKIPCSTHHNCPK